MDEIPDIATVFDDHVAAEFVTRDLDAAMATMAPDPYVFHVPSMTGGDGYENVRSFYGDALHREMAGGHGDHAGVADGRREPGRRRADPLVHPRHRDGRDPPGRRRRRAAQVTLPFCVVVGFEDGKVKHEHIYWDQGSALAQIGLIDAAGLPVTGGEQAANLTERRAEPMNRLLATETD